jgi:hypothetical protein
MNIFWPEGLQNLADKGEITFKDGERLNLNVLRKLDNGMYLINLKGKSFTAQLQTEPEGKMIRAEVVKSENGTLMLKIIPNADQSANPAQITTTTTQQARSVFQLIAGTTTAPQGTGAEPKTVLQLPAGTINAQAGEKVDIQILKTLDNGNTLLSIKNNLFEVKLDAQLLKNLTAEVTKADSKMIELTMDKLPVQNLDTNFVKQEVGGFDLSKLMKAFGKFQKLDVQNMTPEALKSAVKNSGLFMENKLMNGESLAGDEKAQAYVNSDTGAKDGITRMQVTNMLLAGGLLTFLKTEDENIDDTYMRFKKGKNGQNILYVSTKFSQLGDTMMIIRSLNNTHDVIVKTETDISEELKGLHLDRARIHWAQFNPRDKETMNVKNDIVFNMSNFEVII